jgi:hypothetical protein
MIAPKKKSFSREQRANTMKQKRKTKVNPDEENNTDEVVAKKE